MSPSSLFPLTLLCFFLTTGTTTVADEETTLPAIHLRCVSSELTTDNNMTAWVMVSVGKLSVEMRTLVVTGVGINATGVELWSKCSVERMEAPDDYTLLVKLVFRTNASALIILQTRLTEVKPIGVPN